MLADFHESDSFIVPPVMKLRELSIEKLESGLGRHLSKAHRYWAEIQRRKKSAESPDFSVFSDTTRRLLIELWDAPGRMNSHHDIREDVIGDVEASKAAVWLVILRAKNEIEGSGMEIENVRGKTGVPAATLYSWENASRSPINDDLLHVSGVLNVSVRNLLPKE